MKLYSFSLHIQYIVRITTEYDLKNRITIEITNYTTIHKRPIIVVNTAIQVIKLRVGYSYDHIVSAIYLFFCKIRDFTVVFLYKNITLF